MIDTDKYEGHTPADDWESHLIDALFETEFPMTYADNQLMTDAPLLLEAYKRLREGIKEAIHHLTYPAKYDKEVQEQTDKLKEMIG